jgi:hypothetical protein
VTVRVKLRGTPPPSSPAFASPPCPLPEPPAARRDEREEPGVEPRVEPEGEEPPTAAAVLAAAAAAAPGSAKPREDPTREARRRAAALPERRDLPERSPDRCVEVLALANADPPDLEARAGCRALRPPARVLPEETRLDDLVDVVAPPPVVVLVTLRVRAWLPPVRPEATLLACLRPAWCPLAPPFAAGAEARFN